MAPIKAEKLRAMNSYNKGQFLYSLILHALVALSCSLLCSYPNWFPSLRYSMKHFLFTSLPNLSSFLVNPKCVFIIFNVIVVFLMGESKLVGSNTSPSNEIYDEYVERSQSLRGRSHSTFEEREERTVETNISDTHEGYNMGDQSLKGDSTLLEKKEERKLEMNLVEDKVNRIETKEVKKEEVKEVVEVEDDDGDDGEAEEEAGMPAEELNKKAEEFIARVNKQMWLEAKLSVCTEA